MEYTVKKLARLAGITPRALRHYDELGLLTPRRVSSNGYRIYGGEDVDRLSHILYYKELGMPLDEIKKLLSASDFNGAAALKGHLEGLREQRERLDRLISNVEKAILDSKGEVEMSDADKLSPFGEKLVQENEKKYGEEIRRRYGEDRVERSNAKVRGMTQEQYEAVELLRTEYEALLADTFKKGDAASEDAQRMCELHRKWLCFFWDEYTPEAHLGVTQMYVDDERFTAYYDAIAPGCAPFFRDAVKIYTANQ